MTWIFLPGRHSRKAVGKGWQCLDGEEGWAGHLDGGDGAIDPLVVGDVALLVLRAAERAIGVSLSSLG